MFYIDYESLLDDGLTAYERYLSNNDQYNQDIHDFKKVYNN